LFYGIESGCGFLALIAPPGMGKTTLLFHLLEKLRGSAQTVFLFQTQCGSREMFRHLLNDLGIDSTDQDLATMHESLNNVLLSNARKGRRVVLVIDESQNLRESVLETVRLLSDFETPQAKLLQIVLSGQPQLADKLAHPSLTQLRQRISVISRLQPFTRVETMVYIEYRLCRAGYSGPPLFSYAAADMIASGSKGIPRIINNLCFNALTLGFAKRQKQIDVDTVREVLADLDLDGLTAHHSGPEATEDALSSFDGISPSNELTYQDFHDAVRAAWGNGAPVKTELNPQPERRKFKRTNPMERPVEAVVRMSLEPTAASGAPEASVLLNEQEPEPAAAEAARMEPLPMSQITQPAAAKESVAAAQSVTSAGQPVGATATMEMVRPDAKQAEPAPATAASAQAQSSKELGASLKTTWTALTKTVQEAFKKSAETPEKRRAIRGGTAVAIIFAFVLGTVAFARHSREVPQAATDATSTTPASEAFVPSLAQVATPPKAATEKSASRKTAAAKANAEDQPVVVTIKDGQTLGDVTLHYLGQAGPVTTRKIQESNPEITNPDRIYAGSQIRLPASAVRADSAATDSGENRNRTEERQ
jgi:type II secretory pathway predicted ATPase ExeA